jgi:hypothetical protein
MPFNPNDHIMKLKTNKDYLPVAWRLVWLRTDHPYAQIRTELVEHVRGEYALMKATISIYLEKMEGIEAGIATGYGSETSKDFGDYLEKAETKAIGRALGALGYGTQFTGDEFDEGTRIVDSPQVTRRGPAEQEAYDASVKPAPKFVPKESKQTAKPAPTGAKHEQPDPPFAVKADEETGEVDMQPYWDSLKKLRDTYKYTNDQLVELIDTLPKEEHFNLGNMTPSQANWLIMTIPATFDLPT